MVFKINDSIFYGALLFGYLLVKIETPFAFSRPARVSLWDPWFKQEWLFDGKWHAIIHREYLKTERTQFRLEKIRRIPQLRQPCWVKLKRQINWISWRRHQQIVTWIRFVWRFANFSRRIFQHYNGFIWVTSKDRVRVKNWPAQNITNLYWNIKILLLIKI